MNFDWKSFIIGTLRCWVGAAAGLFVFLMLFRFILLGPMGVLALLNLQVVFSLFGDTLFIGLMYSWVAGMFAARSGGGLDLKMALQLAAGYAAIGMLFAMFTPGGATTLGLIMAGGRGFFCAMGAYYALRVRF